MCWRTEGFPLDYSLIVVEPLRRKLAANPSPIEGGEMLVAIVRFLFAQQVVTFFRLCHATREILTFACKYKIHVVNIILPVRL